MEYRRKHETEYEREIREKLEKFHELAKPLHEWLIDNYSPHSMITIDWDFAKVVVEDCGVPLETEY